MEKSESIKNLAFALAGVTQAVSHVPMNAYNKFTQSRYADLGAVIDAIKQPMLDAGLVYSQMVGGSGGYIDVTTILIHQDTGEWMQSTVSFPLTDEKGKSSAQMAGSVVTYMRRYALAAMFGLYADADNDGNDSNTARKPPANKQAPKPTTYSREDDEKRRMEEFMALPAPEVLVRAKVCDKTVAAASLINHHVPKWIITNHDWKALVDWGRSYRAARDGGMDVDDAARTANNSVTEH